MGLFYVVLQLAAFYFHNQNYKLSSNFLGGFRNTVSSIILYIKELFILYILLLLRKSHQSFKRGKLNISPVPFPLDGHL